MSLTGNVLNLSVSYSGGCETHDFVLCWDEMYIKTQPMKIELYLSHNANNDTCEAWETETLDYDLTPVPLHYNNANQTTTGDLLVVLNNQNVMYSW